MDFFPQAKSWSPALLVAVILGCVFNGVVFNTHRTRGYDEDLYVRYADSISTYGLRSYPELVREYTELMRSGAPLCLPPLRVAYVGTAALMHRVTGTPTYKALALLSCAASMASLIWAAFLFQRHLPESHAAGAACLLACAPLRLHLGSRVFIDSVFDLWTWMAVGSLLLACRKPVSRRWEILYALSWFMLVLTKETALLIWLAVIALLAFQALAGARPSKTIGWITLAAPLLPLLLLITLAGGITPFMDMYALFFTRARHWPQALLTGDGPWYRYTIDWIIFSPVPFLLAMCGLTQVRLRDSFVSGTVFFWGMTFLLLSSLRYGLNLRYTTIWNLPISVCASLGAAFIAMKTPRWKTGVFLTLILVIGGLELLQYHDYFIRHALYDPIPIDLLKAKHLLKSASDLK